MLDGIRWMLGSKLGGKIEPRAYTHTHAHLHTDKNRRTRIHTSTANFNLTRVIFNQLYSSENKKQQRSSTLVPQIRLTDRQMQRSKKKQSDTDTQHSHRYSYSFRFRNGKHTKPNQKPTYNKRRTVLYFIAYLHF